MVGCPLVMNQSIRQSALSDERETHTPEELALQARSGSMASFEKLVARFQYTLRNYLAKRTGSSEDAEDLAQETFLRAWRHIGSYDQRWRFSTWLFSIASNRAV